MELQSEHSDNVTYCYQPLMIAPLLILETKASNAIEGPLVQNISAALGSTQVLVCKASNSVSKPKVSIFQNWYGWNNKILLVAEILERLKNIWTHKLCVKKS